MYGKDGGDYLISDPVFETVQRCAAADLQRARFAKGALAAKGLMFTIEKQPENAETLAFRLPQLLRRAIRKNAKHMLAPVFFVGVRGIRTVAKRIAALGGCSEHDAKLYLGHLVRMQEEIGTGGAGFRYLYAYFLEQAAQVCADSAFQAASERMTAIGDQWRAFAARCVKQCRKPDPQGYAKLAAELRAIADAEEALWRELAKAAA